MSLGLVAVGLTVVTPPWSRAAGEPARKPVPSWVWSVRPFFWGLVKPGITPSSAVIGWLRRYGYNAALLQPDLGAPIPVGTDGRSYDRPHWAWAPRGDRNRDVKRFIAQARKAGIRSILQANTWAIGAFDGERGVPILERWRPHAALGADGDVAHVPAPTGGPRSASMVWLCPVNSFVRSALERRIPSIMTDFGYDMFVNDWNVQGFGCRGDHFASTFQADTGVVYPGPGAIASGSVAAPGTRAWRDWSMGKGILRGVGRTGDLVERSKWDRVLFAYNANPIRGEHEAFATFADVLGDEASIRSSFYDWSWQLAMLHLDAAFQRRYRVPVLVLLYTDVPSENFFGWALAHTTGLRLWRAIPELNRLEQRFAELFERSRSAPADFGLLVSRRTLTRYSEFDPVDEMGPRPFGEARYMGGSEGGWGWAGWARVLQDLHRRYDVLLDDDLSSAVLARYPAIVLDNAAVLSAQQVEAVRSYVDGGGTLIATYQTALFDEGGEVLDDFGVGDICGISYRGMQQPSARWEVREGDAGAPIGAGTRALSSEALDTQWFVRVAVSGETRVAAEYRVGDETHPALVLNSYGEGRCAYFAGYPGSRAFLRRVGGGRPDAEPGFTYLDYTDPFVVQMLTDVARWAVGEPFMTSDAPADVVVDALRCRRPTDDRLCVHLLNAGGSRLEHGRFVATVPGIDPFYAARFPGVDQPEDPYGSGYHVPFPARDEFSVELSEPGWSPVRVVAPGGEHVVVEPAGGTTSTSLRVSGLSKYAIVELRREGSAASLPVAHRVATGRSELAVGVLGVAVALFALLLRVRIVRTRSGMRS